MKYYFITIDKCITCKKLPTMLEYHNLLTELEDKCKFYRNHLPVECFEYKHKSKKYPKWLHYHGIVESIGFVKYTEVKKKGYSIQVKLIKTMGDMLRIAGYINKDKKDKAEDSYVFFKVTDHMIS